MKNKNTFSLQMKNALLATLAILIPYWIVKSIEGFKMTKADFIMIVILFVIHIFISRQKIEEEKLGDDSQIGFTLSLGQITALTCVYEIIFILLFDFLWLSLNKKFNIPTKQSFADSIFVCILSIKISKYLIKVIFSSVSEKGISNE